MNLVKNDIFAYSGKMPFAEHIAGDVMAAVIGDPIAHSKSPLMHTSWLKDAGFTGRYVPFHVYPQDLESFLDACRDSQMRGFNATLPHKQALMKLCDELDDEAAAIGAVNTVTIQNDILIGTNTDAFGFTENIRRQASDVDFKAGPALVIGAGGASRAVLYGLCHEACPEIYVTNRTLEKAQNVAKLNKKIKVIPWEKRDEYVGQSSLIVNTTSLGMVGHPPLELDLSTVKPETLVNDIVYTPLQTPLLQDAKAQGCRTVTGLGMLIEQGRKSFHHWFGIWPRPDEKLPGLLLGESA